MSHEKTNREPNPAREFPSFAKAFAGLGLALALLAITASPGSGEVSWFGNGNWAFETPDVDDVGTVCDTGFDYSMQFGRVGTEVGEATGLVDGSIRTDTDLLMVFPKEPLYDENDQKRFRIEGSTEPPTLIQIARDEEGNIRDIGVVDPIAILGGDDILMVNRAEAFASSSGRVLSSLGSSSYSPATPMTQQPIIFFHTGSSLSAFRERAVVECAEASTVTADVRVPVRFNRRGRPVGTVKAHLINPGTKDFSVLTRRDLEIGSDGARATRVRLRDVDGDGDDDLVVWFRPRRTGVTCEDDAIRFAAITPELSFVAEGTIQTRGCCH